MQFGDEGKGTFVDYLVHREKATSVVRYNGGSQASHTVITPDGNLHKFSQLGSGMFYDECHTYLTSNMVVNLDNLLVELEVFENLTHKTDVIKRMHIHEDCYVVTPYHKLINKLRELTKEERRGTVGTGVSEVKHVLDEANLGIQVKDFFAEDQFVVLSKMKQLRKYVADFLNKNNALIEKNVPNEMRDSLHMEIDFLMFPMAPERLVTGCLNNYQVFKGCVYGGDKKFSGAVFEGSQGLLIDYRYGIKPNTTFLDTSINFAKTMADNAVKIGIAKAFESRHGMGVFPTESEEVNLKDPNQSVSFWNGSIRFGWFDAVLFRYAQRINKVDELYLSSIDKLDNFEKIKVCNTYRYNGKVDKTFKSLFIYTIKNGEVIICEIKRNSEELSSYLKKCTPVYMEMDGWLTSTKKATSWEELPTNCRNYITLLEKLTQTRITLVSVGPTREDKVIL